MNPRDELHRVLAGIRACAQVDALVPTSVIEQVDEARDYLRQIPTGDLTSDLTSDQLWEVMLDWRNVRKEDACGECGGAGTKAYGSTATYHGGVGGQMITDGVCNKCWGSGDKTRPWPARKR